ncbi:MAG: class I SAM-dependent methyltransferase, partial [Candidatus Cloacimonetes bacterium]|nr:class I SAM-dependent methyltransferase [Candidatus Cloacimonadota bacterium]
MVMKKRGGYEQSARFYDLFDQKKNIEFYLHHAITRGEILDVGAGTGRIAVALARHGIEVYCVEPSPAMRREFRYKLKKESRLQKLITLVPGSAADFRCPRSYRICIMSGVFDHLLNHEERRASLNNIAHHLSEDGVLIFDVHLGLMGNAPLQSAG